MKIYKASQTNQTYTIDSGSYDLRSRALQFTSVMISFAGISDSLTFSFYMFSKPSLSN